MAEETEEPTPKWRTLTGVITLTPAERNLVIAEFGSREAASARLASYAKGWLEPITKLAEADARRVKEERIRKLRAKADAEEAELEAECDAADEVEDVATEGAMRARQDAGEAA